MGRYANMYYSEPKKVPPTDDRLYCGLFKDHQFVGSLHVGSHMREILKKNGYTLTFWSI
jgi:hypothetical protein